MDLSVLTTINALKKSEIPKQKWIYRIYKAWNIIYFDY